MKTWRKPILGNCQTSLRKGSSGIWIKALFRRDKRVWSSTSKPFWKILTSINFKPWRVSLKRTDRKRIRRQMWRIKIKTLRKAKKTKANKFNSKIMKILISNRIAREGKAGRSSKNKDWIRLSTFIAINLSIYLRILISQSKTI